MVDPLKIAGRRELTQEEVDLINRVKAFVPELEKLIVDISHHIEKQHPDPHEMVSPFLWVTDGTKDLHVGLMKLTRAIAQPHLF